MARGRQRSVIGKKIETVKSDANYWRQQIKNVANEVAMLRRFELFANALDMPLPEKPYNISVCGSTIELNYENEDNRGVLGRLFQIVKWDRHVNEYDGSISLRATVESQIGRIRISLGGASLAPGCRLETVVEMREVKRFRSVCGENNE